MTGETAVSAQNQRLHNIAKALKGYMDEWLTTDARLKSFKKWPFDGGKSPCTSAALAKAGFAMTSSSELSAICVVCEKHMYFEETDDPMVEHYEHAPNCYLINKLREKPESDWTALDMIQIALWREEYKKVEDYMKYVDALEDAMDRVRLHNYERILDAEKELRRNKSPAKGKGKKK